MGKDAAQGLPPSWTEVAQRQSFVFMNVHNLKMFKICSEFKKRSGTEPSVCLVFGMKKGQHVQ